MVLQNGLEARERFVKPKSDANLQLIDAYKYESRCYERFWSTIADQITLMPLKFCRITFLSLKLPPGKSFMGVA